MLHNAQVGVDGTSQPEYIQRSLLFSGLQHPAKVLFRPVADVNPVGFEVTACKQHSVLVFLQVYLSGVNREFQLFTQVTGFSVWFPSTPLCLCVR